jgi:hypothetical protein
MTPDQYRNVDPDHHSPAGLTDEIASTLVLFGYGSQHERRVAEWLLGCVNHDEQAAFDLARKVVKRLRGADAESEALEIHAAMTEGRPPLHS